jgi:hypothetical protein
MDRYERRALSQPLDAARALAPIGCRNIGLFSYDFAKIRAFDFGI